MEIARQAGSEDQLRETGYLLICESPQTFEKAAAQAERVGTTHGVGYRLLSPEELALDQPLIKRRMSGAIHWTEPRSVPDPQILTQRYAGFLSTLGGAFVKGDAMSLSQQGNGWTVMTDEGLIEAEHVVVAIGHASTHLTKRFGYAAPTFGKRGYHIHLKAGESLMPSRPVLYQDKRIMIAPMRQGLRLTSGVEFARPDAPKTPLQLGRAENVIRELFELGEHVEAQPWMGVRPASADMLPIVGPIPGTKGLWAHYGHGHQGLTLGPTTGRLLAEQMSSERTFVDPTPFLPARFA